MWSDQCEWMHGFTKFGAWHPNVAFRSKTVGKKQKRKMNEDSEDSWMRGQQTYPLTIHFIMWTVSSDVSIQRRHWQPLSVHLWAYCTQPTQDVNDVMCEGWPQHQGIRPTCSVFFFWYLSFLFTCVCTGIKRDPAANEYITWLREGNARAESKWKLHTIIYPE